MEFKFTVRKDRITRANNDDFVEGNKGYYEAVFDFGDDMCWNEAAKLCVVECGEEVFRIPIIDGKCLLPTFSKGSFKIGVMGVDTLDSADSTTVISTDMKTCGVLQGAATKEANTELNTAAEIWEIYLTRMEESRKAAESAAKSVRELNAEAENLPEGSDASVEKIENEDGITLRFGIPKGERGPRGHKGNQGDQGPQGEKGDKGETGPKGDTGEAGKDGTNGKDGVSTTHSWNGTVLTVTSASGTSSADLKGDKGDKGEQGTQGPKGDKGDNGKNGADGKDGYSPIRGTDYWTPEDIAEIKGYVDEAILGGAW